MALLTSDFLQNRQKQNRYKRFVLAIAIVLAVVASAAAGFYFYDSSQKQKHEAEAASKNSGTLPKEWLLKYFGTTDENSPRVGGPQGDSDGDILSNEQEFFFGTDPTNPDSDGDGQGDGAEVAINQNPLGAGELYSTENAKQLAERYLAYNNLPEFKEENIQKTVNELLNPPDMSKLEVPLPDPKTLKVGSDNSTAAIDKYISSLAQAVGDLAITQDAVQLSLENPDASGNGLTTGQMYQKVDELRSLTVPSDFLHFHQLHIAGLFAAANVLAIQKKIDPAAEVNAQKSIFQEQYYQVAIIQKVDAELKTDIVALAQKYPDVFNKYRAQ